MAATHVQSAEQSTECQVPSRIHMPGMFNLPQKPLGIIILCNADLGRFTNMLLNKGKVGNKQVVPAAYIEDSIVSTSCLREAMNGNFYNMPWPGAAFHNTFFLDPDRKATYNYGAFGNLLYVDHDASACCVLLSAWEKPNEQIQEWMNALQELVKSL